MEISWSYLPPKIDFLRDTVLSGSIECFSFDFDFSETCSLYYSLYYLKKSSLLVLSSNFPDKQKRSAISLNHYMQRYLDTHIRFVYYTHKRSTVVPAGFLICLSSYSLSLDYWTGLFIPPTGYDCFRYACHALVERFDLPDHLSLGRELMA